MFTETALQEVSPGLQERYLAFCKTPLRNEKMLCADLQALMTHPHIQYLGFAQNTDGITGCLLIGTTHVSIWSKNSWYAIGEFIIHIEIQRYSTSKSCIKIENVTDPADGLGGVMCIPVHPHVNAYAHPHVLGQPGIFCMNEGQAEINAALTERNIPLVFEVLDAGLHSEGPGTAYLGIEHWPKINRPLAP